MAQPIQAAFSFAERKARYGHKDWIVWETGEDVGEAGLCTAENIEKALACLPAHGEFWRISANDAVGTIVQRRLGERMLRNCQRELDGPRVAT